MLLTTQGMRAVLPVCAVTELEFCVAKWRGCGEKVADNSFHSKGGSVPTRMAGWDLGRRSEFSLLLLLLLLPTSATQYTVCQPRQLSFGVCPPLKEIHWLLLNPKDLCLVHNTRHWPTSWNTRIHTITPHPVPYRSILILSYHSLLNRSSI